MALALAAVGALILSGCGVSTEGDFDRGKQLFTAKCAQCHSLRDAASISPIGPDLDAAFAQARAQGMDSETIAGVVKDQVENPRPSTANPAVSMPAGLVEGTELDDLAAYIGEVAGNPRFKGPDIPDDPGALVFLQNGCGSCHVLEAEGSTGTAGPDLDVAIPQLKTAGAIKEAIVDPDKQIARGYTSGIMPTDFGQRISSTDLNDLVQFLLEYSGQKGGSGGGSGDGGGAAGAGPSGSGGDSK